MQTIDYTTVDPFEILNQPVQADEETEATWKERAWLVLFDTLVALELLFFLLKALPVGASAIEDQFPLPDSPVSTQAAPADQLTALTALLTPVEYEESPHGYVFDGPIMYTISVTNRGLIAARNVTVSVALEHDPLLVQAPWTCDFDGCIMLIDEIGVGESVALPLSHGLMVPAVVVEREEDAYVGITPPVVTVEAANSLMATAPTIEETIVCRCLTVYNPEPRMLLASALYLPVGFGTQNSTH